MLISRRKRRFAHSVRLYIKYEYSNGVFELSTESCVLSKGFSIEIELLSKFLKFNRSIFEVPIKYEGRSYSEGKKIKSKDGILYLINTIKYRFLT